MLLIILRSLQNKNKEVVRAECIQSWHPLGKGMGWPKDK